jgi:hypothetical protein
MPDLTNGYRGKGQGNTRVLDAILDRPAVTWRGPAGTLAAEIFTKNFMPYAKSHWAYDASGCNCEHLARAFHATWEYVVHRRRDLGPRENLDKASVEKCFGTTLAAGLVSHAWRVFAGPAQGNVRDPISGNLDGRCLFKVHYMAKIGFRYFDPTFDRMTQSRDDCVERKLSSLKPGAWLSEDQQRLYIRTEQRAPQFADSWMEYSADSWISHQDWKDLSARSGHWRSSNLKGVDAALDAYEKMKNARNLQTLKTAFQNWYARNPKEVSHRNRENCINRLALNLGLAKTLLKTGNPS